MITRSSIALSLVMIGLLYTAVAHASDFWPSLWLTADQRGEELMQQGKAADAVRTYTDPRRKAYAELQAGDAAGAARDFGAFDDSDSQYNRGNALAKSGNLQGAIKAYDSALTRNPNNQDARHNRDLVEQALRQKQSEPKSQNQNDQGKQQDQSQQKQQQSANNAPGSSGRQQKQGSSANDPSDSTKGGQNSQQSSARNDAQVTQKGSPSDEAQAKADKPGSQSNPSRKASAVEPQQGANDSQATQQEAGKSPNQDHQRAQTQAGPQSQPSPDTYNASTAGEQADSAEQAKRDAETSLQKSDADKLAPEDARAGNPANAANAMPKTERQLAQEQWLRSIPDDPGGLLRRKFMIEYLMRHQQAEQP